MAREFNPDNFIPLLGEAQEWHARAVLEPEGAICPCCGRFDKVYHRKINAAAIRNICALYRHTLREGPGYYHYKEFMSGFAGWDVTKFMHLGLVERASNDDKTKQTSGRYAITEAGMAFVRGQIQIPDRLTFYHNELIETSDELKTIDELWPDFNYAELMSS